METKPDYIPPTFTYFECKNHLCKNFPGMPDSYGIALIDWKGIKNGAVMPICDECGNELYITREGEDQ